ncbi:MAG: hypothetical protein AB1656_11425 [Candidatus Omnitrophota bacterium]
MMEDGGMIPETNGTFERATAPIRFGVMCFGPIFQKWQARCLQKLMALENVAPALLIIDDDSAERNSLASRLKRIRWNQLVFQLYNNFLVKPEASRPVDLSETFKDIPRLPCRTVKKGKFSQYFREEDIETIRNYNLDFILRFAYGIIRGEILKTPRYGVWSYHHGDEERYRGGPPCFWEIYHDDPVSGALLQRLTDRLDGGVALKKGRINTCLTSYSRNLNNILLESSGWASQVCIDLRQGAADYLEAPPSPTDAPIYYSPTNRQMAVFGAKIIRNAAKRAAQALFRHDQWNIGMAQQPIQAYLQSGKHPNIVWMPAPMKNQFFADPFALKKEDRHTILFEELDYRIGRGRIFFFQFDDDPSKAAPLPAMENSFHMSYPYLIENEGEIYCVPETYEASEIALYRAVSFPAKWEKIAALVEGVQGVDSTIAYFDRRWWLFCACQENGPNHNLFVYYADDLLGPWRSHANNPVKTDVRSARPGGTPFIHEGTLYRPAQDCSSAYGARLIINRVQKLTPEEFKEEAAGVIEPDPEGPYPDGCHTACAMGNVTIIDGKRWIFIPSAFWQTLKRGLRKIVHRG